MSWSRFKEQCWKQRRAFGYSLRLRLLGLFFLLAMAVAGTLFYGMQKAIAIGWKMGAKPMVVDYVDRLAVDIGNPPDLARAQAIVDRLPLSVRISGPVVNWRSHPNEPDYAGQWHADHPNDPRWESDGAKFFERTTADGHRIQFSLSVQAWSQRQDYTVGNMVLVMLLLTALGYWRVRRMLRPLDDIRDGARRFGAGDFAQPIPVRHAHRPDELGELAATINTMGADIHQMLDAKRALLLAISHELRSPLTRARLNTELLPETADVAPGREALLRDLALMRDLVTDLLESERLANPHAALYREPLDLVALAREVVSSLHNAHAQAAAVTIESPAELSTHLDPTRVRLLLRNLLDNALRHSSQAATAPHITLQATERGTRIVVRDFGLGVEPDQLPQLGQPFFRPDSARTREGGGVGLGLYLCRLVAQAHGGNFTVRNAQPGLEVEVVLPPNAPGK